MMQPIITELMMIMIFPFDSYITDDLEKLCKVVKPMVARTLSRYDLKCKLNTLTGYIQVSTEILVEGSLLLPIEIDQLARIDLHFEVNNRIT